MVVVVNDDVAMTIDSSRETRVVGDDRKHSYWKYIRGKVLV